MFTCRFAGAGEPSTGLAAVEEVIVRGRRRPASHFHIVHITSIGLARRPQLIQTG